jgi:GDPmannose 4,6-dehydratase
VTWHEHVKINPGLFRPNDPCTVVADIAKARRRLGWSPQTSLARLVETMVRADMDALTQFRHNAAAA